MVFAACGTAIDIFWRPQRPQDRGALPQLNSVLINAIRHRLWLPRPVAAHVCRRQEHRRVAVWRASGRQGERVCWPVTHSPGVMRRRILYSESISPTDEFGLAHLAGCLEHETASFEPGNHLASLAKGAGHPPDAQLPPSKHRCVLYLKNGSTIQNLPCAISRQNTLGLGTTHLAASCC